MRSLISTEKKKKKKKKNQKTQTQKSNMAAAIPRITGRFKRRIVFDLVGSVALGTVVGVGYWNLYHLPAKKEWVAYETKVRAETREIHNAWFASQKQE
jgi:hypothetical protein